MVIISWILCLLVRSNTSKETWRILSFLQRELLALVMKLFFWLSIITHSLLWIKLLAWLVLPEVLQRKIPIHPILLDNSFFEMFSSFLKFFHVYLPFLEITEPTGSCCEWVDPFFNWMMLVKAIILGVIPEWRLWGRELKCPFHGHKWFSISLQLNLSSTPN